jgi:hypothetical protein
MPISDEAVAKWLEEAETGSPQWWLADEVQRLRRDLKEAGTVIRRVLVDDHPLTRSEN